MIKISYHTAVSIGGGSDISRSKTSFFFLLRKTVLLPDQDLKVTLVQTTMKYRKTVKQPRENEKQPVEVATQTSNM